MAYKKVISIRFHNSSDEDMELYEDSRSIIGWCKWWSIYRKYRRKSKWKRYSITGAVSRFTQWSIGLLGIRKRVGC